MNLLLNYFVKDMRIDQKINVPIITYHSIDESGSVISTAPATFRRQMEWLHNEGYSAIPLSRLAASLTENDKELSEKVVVLTFDDGFQNFYTDAFPILSELGFVATVFLVTDFCGKHNDWENNPPELPRSQLMDWRQIEELDKGGIEFGVHTGTHPDLTALSEDQLESEIVESKKVIEDALGKEIDTFAYPYGKFDQVAKKMVAANFKAACSTKLGKVNSSSDLFCLERIDSYYLSNERVFNSLSKGLFDQYLKFRHAMRVCKSLVTQN